MSSRGGWRAVTATGDRRQATFDSGRKKQTHIADDLAGLVDDGNRLCELHLD